MSDNPFADRTTSTLEHGTRDARDLRTHTERVNGTGPGRFGAPEAIDEPPIDYTAPRVPYRTIEWTIVNGTRVPPGSIVHLQPHEVGPQHVFTEQTMELLKELDEKLAALREHGAALELLVDRAERAIARIEAAAPAPPVVAEAAHPESASAPAPAPEPQPETAAEDAPHE